MSVVYFIQSGATGPIKIGVATDLKRRVALLQTGNPEPLVILATVEGDMELEAEYHTLHSDDRVRGEWFKPSDKVLASVAAAKPYIVKKRRSLNKQLIALGISKSYASDILIGRQPPSRPLAIHIFRKTGWKHSMLSGLTAEQIDVLESIDPWQPRSAETAA